MDLYLDKLNELENEFRKEAGFAARLSETPENWPQELNSELLRQLPYLSDYEVHVNLMRVEPQRGTAFGYADITNRTERPEEEHAEAGIPHVRIPLVVLERGVKPFSVFMDGERVMPLNEDRFREILFNPQTFDISNSEPRDPSLIEPLMPPSRSGYGMGGEVKTASLTGPFDNTWLAQFEGSPLKAKAIELEEKTLMLDRIDSARRHTEQKHWQMQDEIRYDKRALEIELAKSKTSVKTASEDRHGAASAATSTAVGAGAGAAAGAAVGAGKAAKKVQKAKRTAEAVYSVLSGTKTKVPKAVLQQALSRASKDQIKKKAPVGAAIGATAGVLHGAARWGEKKEKSASLLLQIAPTLRESDVEMFTQKVASDASLASGFRRSGIAPILVEALENTKRASAEDRLSTLASDILPSVVTIQKLPGGNFLFKTANVNAFSEGTAQGQVVGEEEAAEAMGAENAQQMQPGQTATAVADPVMPSTPTDKPNERLVEEFGEYLVQDSLGNRIMGWVIPKTLAWDGNFTPMDVALFTNGSAYAFQDTIAGELVGKGTTLPSDSPRGEGVFYCVDRGNVLATAPLDIKGSGALMGGAAKFTGIDAFGNQVVVSLQEGIKNPTRVSDTEYALPGHWKFMRLNNQTELVSDPVQMNKAAQVSFMRNGVTLFWNGSFNLEGGCGLPKIARDLRYDLDSVQTEFMLGLLGVDGPVAKQKIAQARKHGSVKMAGLKNITPLSERYSASVKTASVLLAKLPDLRRDLIKEAAAIDEAGTVDNLLALNFINPENVATFVSYIPELQTTSEHLAEMLLNAYLGQNDLPESALERSMKNLEEVIKGLQMLQEVG